MTAINDFKIYCESPINSVFEFKKNNDDAVPEMFKDFVDEPGWYSWGVAATDDLDVQGERVLIADEIARQLEKAPFNKVFLEHDTKDIASGVIKFSRVMNIGGKNKHILLERINEGHPKFENILKSIKNKSLDAYSVSGGAPKVERYNPATGKQEILRPTQFLKEVSRTSLPGNPNAFIAGTFQINKSLDDGFIFKKSLGEGGILFKEEKKEGMAMESEYLKKSDFDAFRNEMTALKDQFSKQFEGVNTNVNSLIENLKKFEKAMTQEEMDEEEKKKKMMMDKSLQKPKDTPATMSNEEMMKKISDMSGELSKTNDSLKEMQKTFSQRIGIVNNEDTRFEKAFPWPGKEQTNTPIYDMLIGRRSN